jgi:uncharacterized protein (TIGR02444 family)
MDQTSLWNFAVALYGRPGVSEACLALQDDGGVDVPVLLYGAWLGRQGIGLSQQDVAEIAGSVAAWREEVIVPLRRLRKRLKGGPAPAPSARTDRLRNTIKSAELSAEQIELEMLEAQNRHMGPNSEDATFGNMVAVVDHYRGSEADKPILSLVQAIVTSLSPSNSSQDVL